MARSVPTITHIRHSWQRQPLPGSPRFHLEHTDGYSTPARVKAKLHVSMRYTKRCCRRRCSKSYSLSGEGGASFDRYQQPPYSSWLILLARVTPQEGFELISKKLDEAENKIVN